MTATPLSCGGMLLAAMLPIAASVVMFAATQHWWLLPLGVVACPLLFFVLALRGRPDRRD